MVGRSGFETRILKTKLLTGLLELASVATLFFAVALWAVALAPIR